MWNDTRVVQWSRVGSSGFLRMSADEFAGPVTVIHMLRRIVHRNAQISPQGARCLVLLRSSWFLLVSRGFQRCDLVGGAGLIGEPEQPA